MTAHHSDPILRQLSRLPAATPDARRMERTRARCHRAIARRQRATERRSFGRRVLEPALVGAFSFAYLALLVHDLLRWHGVL